MPPDPGDTTAPNMTTTFVPRLKTFIYISSVLLESITIRTFWWCKYHLKHDVNGSNFSRIFPSVFSLFCYLLVFGKKSREQLTWVSKCRRQNTIGSTFLFTIRTVKILLFTKENNYYIKNKAMSFLTNFLEKSLFKTFLPTSSRPRISW